MSDRFVEGVELFNRGRFFDAHEAWEDVWRDSTGEERRWLQGLVQIAVALHHESTGNAEGARSVLARAIENLEGCFALRGIDVWELREELRKVQSQLAAQAKLKRFEIRWTDR